MEHAHGKSFFYIVALQSGSTKKGDNKHEFGCASKDDTDAWVDVLQCAIAKANAAGPMVERDDVTVGSGVSLGAGGGGGGGGREASGSRAAFDAAMPFDEHGDLPTDDGPADEMLADLTDLYKDGFLEKKGSQRWFLFSGETLSWSMQPTTTDFIGTIQLAVTEVVGGPKPTQFTLKTPGCVVCRRR